MPTPLMTLTRNGNATVWGPDRKLHTAGPDVLREEYDPVTGLFSHYSLEESRTNSYTHSYDLVSGAASGNLNWVTNTTLAYTATGGLLTNGYSSVTTDAASGIHYVGKLTPGGTDYPAAFSFVIDPKSEQFVKFGQCGASLADGVVYDFVNGQIHAQSPAVTDFQATPLSGGLYLVTGDVTRSDPAGWVLGIQLLNATGNYNFAGAGESIDVYHMQGENETHNATSLIITNGSAATRAADRFITDSVDWFSTSRGSFYMDADLFWAAGEINSVFSTDDIRQSPIYIDRGDLTFPVNQGVATKVTHTLTQSANKFIVTWDSTSSEIRLYVNGALVDTGIFSQEDLVAAVGTPFELGKATPRLLLRKTWFNPEVLTDAQAIAETTP